MPDRLPPIAPKRRVPRSRLRVRTLILLVALCGCGLGGWLAYWDSTGRLIRRLRADQPVYVRREAAASLGTGIPASKVEEAIAALIGALDDPSPRVRESATVGLWGHKTRAARAVPGLVELLKDGDRRVRYAAAACLGEVVGPSDPELSLAIPALTTALADPEADVRGRAAESLATLGRPDLAVATLARLWDCPDDMARNRAQSTARRRLGPNDRRLVEALVAAATYQNMAARVEAADVLLAHGRVAEAMPILDQAEKHADPGIRHRSAQVRAAFESRKPGP